MRKTLKLLIVANQRRVCHSLRALFATWPAIAEIREAANGAEALRLSEDYRPDLVLIDGRLASMWWVEITQQIKQHWPEIGVVILSMYSDLEPDVMASGADAFVTRADPPDELLRILETVASRHEQQEKTGGITNDDVF